MIDANVNITIKKLELYFRKQKVQILMKYKASINSVIMHDWFLFIKTRKFIYLNIINLDSYIPKLVDNCLFSTFSLWIIWVLRTLVVFLETFRSISLILILFNLSMSDLTHYIKKYNHSAEPLLLLFLRHNKMWDNILQKIV